MNIVNRPSVPQKSGPSGLAIAGVGCGLLVVVSVVLAVVLLRGCATRVKEAAGEKNPRGERVSVDPLAPNNSDKVVIKWENASSGPGVDPDSTLPPSWVPVYPAAQSQAGGTKQETEDALVGKYLARTKDSPAKITGYFESTLQADGFETDITTSEANGNETAVLTASKDDGKRQITVLANRMKGTTDVTISYLGPK